MTCSSQGPRLRKPPSAEHNSPPRGGYDFIHVYPAFIFDERTLRKANISPAIQTPRLRLRKWAKPSNFSMQMVHHGQSI